MTTFGLFVWACLMVSLCRGTTAWTTPRIPTALGASTQGSTLESKEQYDIVKVDLDRDRDYPIYIGTGYSDEEGASGGN